MLEFKNQTFVSGVMKQGLNPKTSTHYTVTWAGYIWKLASKAWSVAMYSCSGLDNICLGCLTSQQYPTKTIMVNGG